MPINQFRKEDDLEWKKGEEDAKQYLPAKQQTGLYIEGYESAHKEIIQLAFRNLPTWEE